MKQENIRRLSSNQTEELIELLKDRFMSNLSRHRNIEWIKVEEKLYADADKLNSLYKMETTGGEPDVVGMDESTGQIIFYDCSAESPEGRRAVCYDHQAQESRKKNRPDNNAVGMAASMGVDLLSEEQYRKLQKLGNFDTKTSSWIKTPSGIRELGGALFADFRYDHVFIYHNSAQSYYSSRGFRAFLKL